MLETNRQPEKLQEIGTGLTCEWYANPSLVIYTLTAVSAKLVEQWSEHVISLLETWDKSHPYRVLHDLAQPGISLQFAMLVDFDTANIGITSTGRRKVQQILDDNPDFYAYVAVNFNLSVSGQVNRVLANQNKAHPFIKQRTFYQRSNALAWLIDLKSATDSSQAVQV